MPHLTLETIARLVDDTPAGEEAAHLEACAHCRAELEDMRADAAALAALPALEPPADAWPALETRLADEGLLRRPSRMSWGSAAVRIAAAIALFVLGAVAGTAWRGGDAAPALADAAAPVGEQEPAVAAPTALARQEPQPRTVASPPAGPSVVARQPEWARSSPRLAAVLAGQRPEDYEEAVGYYREAETVYLDALTRMQELTGGEYGDPYARLAALEAITSITRAALGQAPADPVINGYHVTALAQRDATLRQIAARTTESWF
jgi:hypothetical protein